MPKTNDIFMPDLSFAQHPTAFMQTVPDTPVWSFGRSVVTRHLVAIQDDANITIQAVRQHFGPSP